MKRGKKAESTAFSTIMKWLVLIVLAIIILLLMSNFFKVIDINQLRGIG